MASLSSLDVSAAEVEAFAEELTRIVEHFETLRQVPDSLLAGQDDAPSSPLRPDVPAARGETPPAYLSDNAPELSHGHFVVPRVVTRSE